MERRTVEQLGIDDVANTYLPPQADVAKRVRRTRKIGAALVFSDLYKVISASSAPMNMKSARQVLLR